jgi:hypothetical protein
MAWDLVLADNGDVILSANRDLLGVSGTALIEQRIRLRLKLHRGEWIYDENDTLGSQLFQLSGLPPAEATRYVGAHVREALRDMDEISIYDVQIEYGDRGIDVVVQYQVELSPDEGGIPGEIEPQVITVGIPGGLGGI